MDQPLPTHEKRPHSRKAEKQAFDACLEAIRLAATPEELDAIADVPLRYAHGQAALKIKAARIAAGRTLCARHPLGYMLPKAVNGIVILAGETFRIGKRPERRGFEAMTTWALGILQQHGLSPTDAETLMDQWFNSPHSCIQTLRRSIQERRTISPAHAKNAEELRAA